MCTRYSLHQIDAAVAAIARSLGIELEAPEAGPPRYNVAPSQLAPVVAVKAGAAGLRSLRWGLIPPMERGLARPRLMTNARAETVTRLPAFREAAARRRCLVPASGFYEFKDLGARKAPYFIARRDGEPLVLAGLWEEPVGGEAGTFCILTTEPNATVGPIHNRMPVILTGEGAGRWLGEEPLAGGVLPELTRPAAADLLAARPVNPYVNNSRHEGPQCLAEPEPELF